MSATIVIADHLPRQLNFKPTMQQLRHSPKGCQAHILYNYLHMLCYSGDGHGNFSKRRCPALTRQSQLF
jgi:hypothetical protein